MANFNESLWFFTFFHFFNFDIDLMKDVSASEFAFFVTSFYACFSIHDYMKMLIPDFKLNGNKIEFNRGKSKKTCINSIMIMATRFKNLTIGYNSRTKGNFSTCYLNLYECFGLKPQKTFIGSPTLSDIMEDFLPLAFENGFMNESFIPDMEINASVLHFNYSFAGESFIIQDLIDLSSLLGDKQVFVAGSTNLPFFHSYPSFDQGELMSMLLAYPDFWDKKQDCFTCDLNRLAKNQQTAPAHKIRIYKRLIEYWSKTKSKETYSQCFMSYLKERNLTLDKASNKTKIPEKMKYKFVKAINKKQNVSNTDIINIDVDTKADSTAIDSDYPKSLNDNDLNLWKSINSVDLFDMIHEYQQSKNSIVETIKCGELDHAEETDQSSSIVSNEESKVSSSSKLVDADLELEQRIINLEESLSDIIINVRDIIKETSSDSNPDTLASKAEQTYDQIEKFETDSKRAKLLNSELIKEIKKEVSLKSVSKVSTSENENENAESESDFDPNECTSLEDSDIPDEETEEEKFRRLRIRIDRISATEEKEDIPITEQQLIEFQKNESLKVYSLTTLQMQEVDDNLRPEGWKSMFKLSESKPDWYYNWRKQNFSEEENEIFFQKEAQREKGIDSLKSDSKGSMPVKPVKSSFGLKLGFLTPVKHVNKDQNSASPKSTGSNREKLSKLQQDSLDRELEDRIRLDQQRKAEERLKLTKNPVEEEFRSQGKKELSAKEFCKLLEGENKRVPKDEEAKKLLDQMDQVSLIESKVALKSQKIKSKQSSVGAQSSLPKVIQTRRHTKFVTLEKKLNIPLNNTYKLTLEKRWLNQIDFKPFPNMCYANALNEIVECLGATCGNYFADAQQHDFIEYWTKHFDIHSLYEFGSLQYTKLTCVACKEITNLWDYCMFINTDTFKNARSRIVKMCEVCKSNSNHNSESKFFFSNFCIWINPNAFDQEKNVIKNSKSRKKSKDRESSMKKERLKNQCFHKGQKIGGIKYTGDGYYGHYENSEPHNFAVVTYQANTLPEELFVKVVRENKLAADAVRELNFKVDSFDKSYISMSEKLSIAGTELNSNLEFADNNDAYKFLEEKLSLLESKGPVYQIPDDLSDDFDASTVVMESETEREQENVLNNVIKLQDLNIKPFQDYVGKDNLLAGSLGVKSKFKSDKPKLKRYGTHVNLDDDPFSM